MLKQHVTLLNNLRFFTIVEMLRPKSKNRPTEKSTKDPFDTGLLQIRNRQYKKAAEIFKKALETSPASAEKKLMTLFREYYNVDENEAVLAIGKVLLERRSHDCNFLNMMGNSARKSGNFKSANDFYRKALGADKSYSKALYNLAASLARAEKYDHEVKKAIEPFQGIRGYLLPRYLNDPDIVDNIVDELNKEKEDQTIKVGKLLEEKERAQKAGDLEKAKECVRSIESVEEKMLEPTYENVCRRLRRAIKKKWKQQTIEESKLVLQQNQFNLGLYALSQGDARLAEENFFKLISEGSDLEYLDLLAALTKDLKGSTREAMEELVSILNESPDNRLANINLGLLYQKTGNRLLAYRYLVKGAELLEQSEGLYDINEIIGRANEYLENEEYQKALNLYHISVAENPTIEAWLNIGEVHIKREQFPEAVMAFHEVQEIEPGNETAAQKLIEIHDIYRSMGEQHFRNKEFAEAAEKFMNALELNKTVNTMQKALEAFEKREDQDQVKRLKAEIKQTKEEEQAKKLEQMRQSYIIKGKALMKKKDFYSAIETLEKAMNMKPDKDVFVMLAHIYKGLNQTGRLTSLMRRYNKQVEQEQRNRNEKAE